MDPFSSSPAQPHSVMSSLFGGGQTPASGIAGHGFGGPGSVFFNHNSLLSGAGPGSIMGGPGSILNSSNGPNSIGPNNSILSGFDRAGIEGLSSVHYSDPGSVLNNNLAVPMTPLAGGESSVQNNMPASNIPMMMPATPMTNLNAVDVPSPTFSIDMVGSCDVKFPIQLEGLCITHAQFSTYEPELFPGLIYRMVKVVITGAKFKSDIDEAFNQIFPILKGFKK